MCHLKMKAWPINIIGEHLLLVTTQGELERSPHPSATPESGWGGPSSAGRPVHPSLTSGMLDTGVHVWSRHLPASAGPKPPLADRRENAPAHMKNALGIALPLPLTRTLPTHTEEQARTHTSHHQCTLLRCLPNPQPL